MKSKKWLSFLLVAVMMLTMVPMTAFAAGGTGTIEAISPFQGEVNGSNITFKAAELSWSAKDESIGRYQDGWWIGTRIIAPSSVTSTNVNGVMYSNKASGELNKSFGTNNDGSVDGRYFINCWPPVQPEYLENALKNNTVLSWTYRFDWDGDKQEDQTFTITVDPSNITLKKDNAVYCETKDGVMVVSEGKPVVATVDGTAYTAINDAIAAANGKTLTLQANAADVKIPEGTTVTLDLNGHTISSSTDHAITNYGVLTVTGAGTVDGGTTAGKGAIYNAPGATADLNGGTFTGSKWYVIKNLGTMAIDGARLEQKDNGSSAIANGYYGSLVNDCGQTKPASAAVTLRIADGSVSGGMNAVKNDEHGVLTITGGTFSTAATNGATILNWNKAEITGGTFTAGENTPAVISNGSYGDAGVGELTIKGGEFSGGTALFGDPAGNDEKAVTTITNGKFTGSFPASSDADINISGGTYSNEVPSVYAAEGFAPVQNADGSYGVHTHSYGNWMSDVNGHWHECACGNKADEAQHSPKTVNAKEATATEKGYTGDTVCEMCGYEIAKGEEIPALGETHTHSYSSAWTYDANGHWHACACGDKTDEAKHTPKTVNAKEATTSEKGYTGDTVCEICGYEIAKGEEIPVISDPNTPQTGDNSKLPLWIALMAAAVAGLGGTVWYGKKKKAR